MPKPMEAICIVNPNSGNKKWERDNVAREGLEFYAKGNIEITKSKEHTIKLAAMASFEYPLIIAVGGDGTILDVINGIMESGNKPILGIVPLGTGNCFVDSLGISKDVKKACMNLAKGKPKSIDLTEILAVNDTNTLPYYKFKYSQVSSIGLDAEILHIRDMTGMPGIRGYVIPTLKTVFKYKPKPKKITLENGYWFGGRFGKKVIKLDNNMQTVVNKGKYYGGKFKISPKAELDDGYLDVSLFNLTKADALLNFYKIYLGKYVEDVITFKAKKVIVEGNDLPCQHDGEFLGKFDWIEFNVKEKALEIIVPY